MTTIEQLPTPTLLLDKQKLHNNIAVMQQQASKLGVTLRPHLKTAKSVQVANCFGSGTSLPITVSTLAEAEYFAKHGFTDITYAVGFNPNLMARLASLYHSAVPVRIIVDDLAVARQVAQSAAQYDITVKVMIEIDTDGHRAGVEPDDPQLLKIAEALSASAHIELCGVLTHAGGSYDCHSESQLIAHAEQERAGCVAAADACRAHGIDIREVSVGSTPTAMFASHLQGVTELRAGVFVFQDLFQVGLGVCELDDIAVSVLTTVIGHKARQHRLIVDAGGLALSKDRSTQTQGVDCGYGSLADAVTGRVIEQVKVTGANQEHGIIDLPRHIPLSDFAIGSKWRILPNHACMTAAAYDNYHVHDGCGGVLDRWARINGW
ncbi:alanine racemase [Aestuariibacter salexigens]|uniref:alanine racemase n=1 Tax=Aestuariibacter salexigens TaxID=226010 RepID=UPI0003FADF61|nr:alanine racemase [Aestuariibacter salexigens]